MTSCYRQNDLYDTHAVHMGCDLHYLHANQQQGLERFNPPRQTQEYKPPPTPFLDEESLTYHIPATIGTWTFIPSNIFSFISGNTTNQSSYGRYLACGGISGHHSDLFQTHAVDRDSHRTHTPHPFLDPMIDNVATPVQNAEDCSAEEDKPTGRNWKWAEAGKALLNVAVNISTVGSFTVALWQCVKSN